MTNKKFITTSLNEFLKIDTDKELYKFLEEILVDAINSGCMVNHFTPNHIELVYDLIPDRLKKTPWIVSKLEDYVNKLNKHLDSGYSYYDLCKIDILSRFIYDTEPSINNITITQNV